MLSLRVDTGTRADPLDEKDVAEPQPCHCELIPAGGQTPWTKKTSPNLNAVIAG
jgi:hypothetical protein